MLVHHILKLIYCEWSKQSQSMYHSTQPQPPPSSCQGDTSLLDNQSKYHLGTVSIEVILVLYISTNTSALTPMNYILHVYIHSLLVLHIINLATHPFSYTTCYSHSSTLAHCLCIHFCPSPRYPPCGASARVLSGHNHWCWPHTAIRAMPTPTSHNLLCEKTWVRCIH